MTLFVSGLWLCACGNTVKAPGPFDNGDPGGAAPADDDTSTATGDSDDNGDGDTTLSPGDTTTAALPVISIDSVQHAEGQSGTTQFVFTVSLDSAPAASAPVSVSWGSADGTATAGSDYTAASGTLTFTSDDPLEQTVTITVTGDTNLEADETFTVVLSNLVNATAGTTTGTGTIEDDDFPNVSIAGASGYEGTSSSATVFTFTVTISDDPPDGLPAQVAWATSDGTATAPDDYTSSSGTLTFTHGGSLSQTINIDVVADGTTEPNETFQVVLSSPVHASVATGTATGTIDDDDFPSLSIADASVNEGTGGTTTLSFTVTLSVAPAVGNDVSVGWATADGTASAGSDYTAASGTLTFTSTGALTQTIAISVNPDSVIEPNETLSVVLSSPANAVLSDDTAIGTILADDFPTVSIAGVTALEGNSGAGNFNFVVSISADAPPGLPLQVTWATSDVTATSPSDYVSGGGTLTFTSGGALTQTIPIVVAGDVVAESDETFEVILSSPVDGVLGIAIAVGTIENDDYPSVSISDTSVVEGTGAGTTTLSFSVNLDHQPNAGQDVQVHWASADGTAGGGSDYTAASGTLTFTSSGSLTQSVAITVTRDSTIEPDETMHVTLSSPTDVTISRATATGTITADDFPSVSIADMSLAEGNSGTSLMTFTATLSAAPPTGYPASVHYATVDGTATAGSDYVAASGTLTFAVGGGLTQTASVTINGDTTLEGDETFTLTLSSPTNVTLGTATATGTITNDDNPVLSIADTSILEGTGAGTTTLSFVVSLDRLPDASHQIQVSWTTADGSASSASDYTAANGTLTFTSTGTLSQTISVDVGRDTNVEPDETVRLNLSSPVNATISRASATGTITADDFPNVSIANLSQAEGNSGSTSFSFTVTLSAPPPTGYPLGVGYATANGSAIAGTDYTAKTGTLSVPAGGSTTQAIIVSVLGDTTEEPDETFTLTLSGGSNLGTISGSPATGTILSDDAPHTFIDAVSLAEGNSGQTNAVVTVRLSSDPLSSGAAQVGYVTLDGSAVSPGDYQSTSGTLTFTHGGPLTQTISVPVNGDTLAEDDEIFSVKLSATANVNIDESIGVVTVQDDEVPWLSIDDVTLAEGNSGTTAFVFTVTTSAIPASGHDITVGYATAARSATTTADFAGATGTLTFTSTGSDTQTVSVNVVGDTTAEAFEEFSVELAGVTNARLRDPHGLGTIVDDDGAVIRVDASATTTADGLTWASAYKTVQLGVDRAQALGGGQVWVAAGDYTNGGGTGVVLTMRSGVTVLGGFSGYASGAGTQETALTQRDVTTNVTVLDGATTAYTVVVGANNAVLDGFTVSGGNANNPSAGSSQAQGRAGGGMFNNLVSPTVSHCKFKHNKAGIGEGASVGSGGAMFNNGFASGINPYIHDTLFTANSVIGYSAGIYDLYANTVVEDCAFLANTASDESGALYIQNGLGSYLRSQFVANTAPFGGAVNTAQSSETFRSCNFTNNYATTGGGALQFNTGNDRLYDSVVMNNATDNSGSASGGGLILRGSGNGTAVTPAGFSVVNVRVENNFSEYGGGINIWTTGTTAPRLVRLRIANNRAEYGGGVEIEPTALSPVFVDTVFEGNLATQEGGAVCNIGSSPTFTNCTFMNDVSTRGAEFYDADSETSSYDSGTGTYIFTFTPSVPALTNSIIYNHTAIGGVTVFYDDTTNSPPSSHTLTSSVSTEASQDPSLVHVPLRSSFASGGTTTTLTIYNDPLTFAVSDVIGINNDGVARTVSAVTSSTFNGLTTTTVTFSPALAVAPTFEGARVDDWGPGATDLRIDLHLAAASICIDAGNNTRVPADIMDLDGDGNTGEPVPYDEAGNARFADDAAVTDTGVGTAPIVDIGAYEVQP